MSTLIVPVESHFPAKVTTKGVGVIAKIKEKFTEHGLIEKAENSPFGQFLKAPTVTFSGAIIHQLLLRKVATKNPNELVFNIGGKNLTFGIREFALLTGLKFGPDPDDVKWSELLKNRRLIEAYFNDKEDIKAGELELAFLNCNEAVDVWSLGLCYLVSGLLMSSEQKSQVFGGLLSLVEDEEEFFSYPWGRHVYYRTLNGVNKDMVHYQEIYQGNVKEKKPHPEAKYTIYGFHVSLIYWAFEAIPMMANLCGKNVGRKVPRMLSWTSTTSPTSQQVSEIFKRKSQTVYAKLQPRAEEKDFLQSVQQGADDGSLLVAGSEKIPEVTEEEEGGKTEEEQEPERTSQLQKLCADVAEIKAKQPVLESKLDTINAKQLVLESKMDTIIQLLMKKKGPYSDSDSEGTVSDKLPPFGVPAAAAAVTPPPSPAAAAVVTPSSAPTAAVVIPPPSTAAAAAVTPPPAPTAAAAPTRKIKAKAQRQIKAKAVRTPPVGSTPVKIVERQDVEDVQFKRRRVPSTRLGDFTDPSGKKFKVADPCKPNPARPFDKNELKSFNKWLAGFVKGVEYVDVGVGDGDITWFFKLKTRGMWLDDKHIDAALFLIRERLWLFPKTYGTKSAVADLIFPQYFTARWGQFKEKRNKEKFDWDPELVEFFNGDPGKYKRPWKDVEYVYYPMNLKGSHWILCQISLDAWMITAFDSDQTVATHAEFDKAMEPMAKMLPYYFLHCGLFESRNDLTVQPNDKLMPFDFRRLLHDQVPQSKKSGDCGVYVIKHLECLLAGLPLIDIVDENMTFFREKLCVDLYFHHLEP